jgi:cytochrome c oxidase subunit 2
MRIVVLLLLAVAAAVPAAAQGRPDRSALGERGRAVFMKNGCHGCHTIGAMGTPIGPDLSRVGFKYRAEYLAAWLRDPALMRPRTHMPRLELTEDDVRVLAAYLASLE